MKTKLAIAISLIGIILNASGQSNRENSIDASKKMKTELPKGLPFKPDDPGVEVVSDSWNGNIQTLQYRWQGRNFEEKRVWYDAKGREPESLQIKRRTVTAALEESGLDLPEDAISRILRAIQRADYSGVSERIRQRPHLVGTMNFQLKRSVSGALGTTDPDIIKKVLTLDLGTELPPLPDYVVRSNMIEEINALENSLQAGVRERN